MVQLDYDYLQFHLHCYQTNILQLLQKQEQQTAEQAGAEEGNTSYDEQQYSIIENYMKDNGYSESDIQIVLDSFASGSLSFEDFKNSTGTTDEDLEIYKIKPEEEELPQEDPIYE